MATTTFSKYARSRNKLASAVSQGVVDIACDLSFISNLKFHPSNSASSTLILSGILDVSKRTDDDTPTLRKIKKKLGKASRNVILKIGQVSHNPHFDNSLQIEQDVYINVINGLLKNNITPHIVPYITMFSCNNFTKVLETANIENVSVESNKTEAIKRWNQINLHEKEFVFEQANIMVLEMNSINLTLHNFLKTDPSIEIIRSIMFQVYYTLLTFNLVNPQLRHNDLHFGNILVEYVPNETLTYVIENETYQVPTNGYMIKIFDFDRAYNGKVNTLLKTYCNNYGTCSNFNAMFDTFTVLFNFNNFIINKQIRQDFRDLLKKDFTHIIESLFSNNPRLKKSLRFYRDHLMCNPNGINDTLPDCINDDAEAKKQNKPRCNGKIQCSGELTEQVMITKFNGKFPEPIDIIKLGFFDKFKSVVGLKTVNTPIYYSSIDLKQDIMETIKNVYIAKNIECKSTLPYSKVNNKVIVKQVMNICISGLKKLDIRSMHIYIKSLDTIVAMCNNNELVKNILNMNIDLNEVLKIFTYILTKKPINIRITSLDKLIENDLINEIQIYLSNFVNTYDYIYNCNNFIKENEYVLNNSEEIERYLYKMMTNIEYYDFEPSVRAEYIINKVLHNKNVNDDLDKLFNTYPTNIVQGKLICKNLNVLSNIVKHVDLLGNHKSINKNRMNEFNDLIVLDQMFEKYINIVIDWYYDIYIKYDLNLRHLIKVVDKLLYIYDINKEIITIKNLQSVASYILVLNNDIPIGLHKYNCKDCNDLLYTDPIKGPIKIYDIKDVNVISMYEWIYNEDFVLTDEEYTRLHTLENLQKLNIMFIRMIFESKCLVYPPGIRARFAVDYVLNENKLNKEIYSKILGIIQNSKTPVKKPILPIYY